MVNKKISKKNNNLDSSELKDFTDYHNNQNKFNKIHCSECNQLIPKDLLREVFYDIVISPAVFVSCVTGKGTGKTLNFILFQVWYIMNHEEGHFVWLWRHDEDRLKKGKFMWELAFNKFLPEKKLSKFKIEDFKWDSRGDYVTAKGVKYKKKQRIYFFSLQKFRDMDSALGGDALQMIFDEAIPSDKKILTDPNEEYRWGLCLDNAMREGKIATRCIFLGNPHMKGIWWIKRLNRPEWLEKAFGQETEPHYFDGEVLVKIGKLKDKYRCILYQSPRVRGEYGKMLDVARGLDNLTRGTFDPDADKHIKRERPSKFKQIYFFKGCVYCRSKWNWKEYFFYLKQEDEIIDPDILHVCFTREEYDNSPCANKLLQNDNKSVKRWVDMLFWQLQYGNLYFTEPDADEAKLIISSFIHRDDKKEQKE